MQRSAELATREKERAQSELARVNTVKEKLEALCRELQKQVHSQGVTGNHRESRIEDSQ